MLVKRLTDEIIETSLNQLVKLETEEMILISSSIK